jgi:ribulose-phosphate 3-epimerase
MDGSSGMRISASLYAADPLRLSEAVQAVAPYVGSFHIDIMDGRFASAFGLGEALVRSLLAEGLPPLDIHLMLEYPEPWIHQFAFLGVRSIAFHSEAVCDVRSAVSAIRAAGCLAYIAFLPEAPVARISQLLPEADGILLLTAPPGGGAFNAQALARLQCLPKALPKIVDGRIGTSHFDLCRSAGVEFAVLGRALFEGEGLAQRARELSSLAAGNPTDWP